LFGVRTAVWAIKIDILIPREEIMGFFGRQGLFIVFASFLVGSAASWWSRMYR
jgi:hypothetical protein